MRKKKRTLSPTEVVPPEGLFFHVRPALHRNFYDQLVADNSTAIVELRRTKWLGSELIMKRATTVDDANIAEAMRTLVGYYNEEIRRLDVFERLGGDHPPRTKGRKK